MADEDDCTMCGEPLAELERGGKLLAKPVGCVHVSCAECMMRWVERSNTCPVCRHRMAHVELLRDGEVEQLVPVEERNAPNGDSGDEGAAGDEEDEEVQVVPPPVAQPPQQAGARRGVRQRAPPNAWSSDDEEDGVGPALDGRRVRQRQGARAPPRRRWPDRPIEYDADGRPQLVGRRDVPTEVRRQAMLDFIAQRDGQAHDFVNDERLGREFRRRNAAQRARDAAGHAARRARVAHRSRAARGDSSDAMCNVTALHACDATAFANAAAVDVGQLGAQKCVPCGALLFRGEAVALRGGGVCGGRLCCNGGKVQLAPVGRALEVDALFADGRSRLDAMKHARSLNNALALASQVVHRPNTLPGNSTWAPSVKIQGKLYHKLGPLLPGDDTPRFAQIYIHDPAEDAQTALQSEHLTRVANMRFSNGTSVAERERTTALLSRLQTMLHASNPWVQDFVMAGELMQTDLVDEAELIISRDVRPVDAQARQFDPPNGGVRRVFQEVTVLVGEQRLTDATNGGAIRLTRRDGNVWNIDYSNRAHDPLHFVLMFPLGDEGWHYDMPYATMDAPAPAARGAHGGGGVAGGGGAAGGGGSAGGGGAANEEDDDNNDGAISEADSAWSVAEECEATAARPCGGNFWCAPCWAKWRDAEARRRRAKRHVSVREFYAYRLNVRELLDGTGAVRLDADGRARRDEALHRWGRLFQEYACMALAKIEMHNLRWYESNQATIRADLYQNLSDAVGSGHPTAGQRVVLPSSFTGGDRDMRQKYHDGMAAVRKRGKPSFFLTMTCNPSWDEVTAALGPGQMPSDRPDLLCRVFRLKLQELCRELYTDGIFGRVVAFLHVIEFQKRGLPHAHILVVLGPADQVLTNDDIDACVSAELPPPPRRQAYADQLTYDAACRNHSELLELVVTHLTHHECGAHNPGASCMVDGHCKDHFPRPFQEETVFNEDQIHPLYRRRRGATYMARDGRLINNQWIVPHSPYLLLKYRCHLNVEVCFSVGSVKYLYKYLYKGPDRAMVHVRDLSIRSRNEIELFHNMRSFGSAEACWRTFAFDMSDRAPAVERMACHLDGQQRLQWREGDEQAAVDAGAPQTPLTEWFVYLRHHPEARRPRAERAMTDAEPEQRGWSATFPDFPERYRWDRQRKAWVPRRRFSRHGTIARVFHIHPGAGEVYYLRMLLHRVPGCELALLDVPFATAAERDACAFTFDALKFVAGTRYATYKAACEARGLLQGDAEAWRMLTDAAEEAFAPQIRRLFAWVLEYNHPLEPMALFDHFGVAMGDDFARLGHDAAHVRAQVLLALEQMLLHAGRSLDAFGMVFTPAERQLAAAAQAAQLAATPHQWEPREVREELVADVGALRAQFDASYAQLRTEQRAPVDAALDAIERGHSLCLFLDAPGGTGKTFCANTLLAGVRSRGEVALAVASSGIAAILLELGRTFHSRCKAPKVPAPGQMLNIDAQTAVAELFRRARLLLWDEGAMGNRYHLEALDRTLRDLMKMIDPRLEYEPFGGKVIVVAGDFRQTLPVVPRASKPQILQVTLNASLLWRDFHTFRLTENMRIRNAAAAGADTAELSAFADWLLRIGNGTEPCDDTSTITLPTERWPELCEPSGADIERLCAWTYPGLLFDEPVTPELEEEQLRLSVDVEWLSQRAILAPHNRTVDEINAQFLASFPGEQVDICSADAIDESSEGGLTPDVEFLNSIDLPGFPAHRLTLKKFMPLMLLRNLAPSDGLCNGTRLVLLDIVSNDLLKVRIATGKCAGNVVYINRLRLNPEAGHFPFEWSRLQFPVRPAFAMTINKAQGQTLRRVGVYLARACFSHGQLYVAISRVGLPSQLRFAVPRDPATGLFKTRNIVYREAFQR